MKTLRKLQNFVLVMLLGLSATYVIPIVNAQNVITINADNSISPPDAPITQNGNIYVLTANIDKSIEIRRNNTLFDGQGYSIQGTPSSEGISLSGTENVTVRNTKVSGFLTGVKLGSSVNNAIADTTITNCTYGIIAHRSVKARITNNTVLDNKWDGIFITASPDSQITNNTVDNNGKWGIYLGFSNNCKLRNNQMTGNAYNFGVSVDFTQDIDTTNTVDGRPIIFWVNKSNLQVPADAGYLALVNSYSIEAQNLHLASNGQGIILANSANIHIENCNITGNAYYGIALIDSDYNNIANNTMTRCNSAGITLVSSTGNSVTNNTIRQNDTGIHLQTSSGNFIHHNNLINNTRQAVTQDSANTWDDGYPSGGNYWSNYNGEDADNDGIGDTSYIIDNDNQDKYPLMTPVTKMPNKTPDLIALITPFLILTTIAIMIAAIATVLYKSRKKKEHTERQNAAA